MTDSLAQPAEAAGIAKHTTILQPSWILSGTTQVSWHQKSTRSPAVARMADRTAPVVKLTLTLTYIAGPVRVRRRLGTCHGGRTGHSLAKTGTSPSTGPS